jgi:predicted amidohydrolase/ribosomal protein S18 acetylase RimI-like enzyme
MSKKQPKLFIRNAIPKDVPAIVRLLTKVYSAMAAYKPETILGQINNWPDGHFVAILDDEVIGYCATIRLDEKKCLAPHTWREITGNGFGTTHDPKGDFLYGYEIVVDPSVRRYRIGRRLYDARKALARKLNLKGIIFAGRLPLLAKKIKQVLTPENYIEMVKAKKIRDPVLSFQLRNGFEVIGGLPNYIPQDKESLGYAALLIWKNPNIQNLVSSEHRRFSQRANTVRVATVQYKQRRISSFDEFKQMVNYFVDVVSDYRSDFVVFPEFFTLQLLSIHNEPIVPDRALRALANYSDDLNDFFYHLAIKYNVNIIAGSHPTVRKDDGVYNTSFIYLRDGTIYEQSKIHPTPNERYWWNIKGDNRLTVINTDCGPIGVLICYDAEFPELSRYLVNQGANILFIPFLTDERQSYLRVRYCAQARCIENQIYTVMSGNVGNLPNVHNMDIHYAQSCILTPCDFSFARDGIAADTSPNVETVAFADLRLDNLLEARNTGTVQNLSDRRHDLYSVDWHVGHE